MENRDNAFGPESFGAAVFGVLAPVQLGVALRQPAPGADFEALPDPFARLGEGEGPATLVLGRLSVPGLLDRSVVFAVERDDCASGSLCPIDNATQRATFEAHHRELQSLAHAGAATVRPLPLVRPGREEGELPSSPPLYFCKRRRLFFLPPCPSCGQGLVDCDDEELLASHGLPSYAASTRRFLYCGTCGVGSGPGDGRFFCCDADGRDSAVVADRWELVLAWGSRVRRAPRTPDPTFPCLGCTHAGGCYPEDGGEGDALRLLVPFSFHGFRCFVVEHLPLRYAEYCDIVGGQPWDGLRSALAEAREYDRLAALDESAAPSGRTLLFEGEPAGRTALEVLFLKLSLFQELCRGVEAVHRTLGSGHFNLRPAIAWVGLAGLGPCVPGLWGFELRLTGLEEACPVASEGERRRSQKPPSAADPVYAHPSIASGTFGAPLAARLRLLAVQPSDSPPGSYTVTARLIPTSEGLAEVGARDRFLVQLDRVHGFRGALCLEFALGGREREGLTLRTAPMALDPQDLAQLESLRSVPYVESACSIDHWFGPECDLYSLGMMLLRTLLVNGTQDAQEVLERCRDLSARVRQAIEGGPAADSSTAAAEWLNDELRDPLFHPRNLLFAPSDTAGEAVPWDLWEAVLTFAFRLTVGLPEVGGADEDPWSALAPVIEDLARLRHRAEHALLSEPVGVDRDLRELLSGILEDPEWLDAALAPKREPIGSEGTAGQAPEGPVPEAPPPRPSPPPETPSPQEPPDLESTVILRPGGVDDARPAKQDLRAPEPRPQGGAEDLERTVILRADAVAPPVPEPAEPAGAQKEEGTEKEDLDKTIIIRPGKRSREK